MPRQRITKDMVVGAAFEIVRNDGMEQITAKNIADKIGCSVQPIYSYCKNMDGLKRDVVLKTKEFIQEYVAVRLEGDNIFESTGKAYIQLAGEEPHLFRVFILHQRENITSLSDLYQSEANPRMAEWIAKNMGISVPQARELHLNMLIYTIGLGTILAVTTPGIPAKEIYEQHKRAYQAFFHQMK